MVLSLFLRVITLGAQSVWGDDFICIGHIDTFNYHLFQQQVRTTSLDMPPLYFFLVYEWSRAFGTLPVAVRMLSVIFGVISTALVFFIGKRLFSQKIGLVASLLFALSPVQIFHAQDMRGYSLNVFWGLLSVLTFLLMLEKSGIRYWIINAAVNAALVWTHLVGVLMPLLLGGILLSRLRAYPRKIFLWGLIQVVLLLPLSGYAQVIFGGAPSGNRIDGIFWMIDLITTPFLNEACYLIWAIPQSYYYDEGIINSLNSSHFINICIVVLHLCLGFTMASLTVFCTWRFFRMSHCNKVGLLSATGNTNKFCPTFPENAYRNMPFYFLLLWMWMPRVMLYVVAGIFDPNRLAFRYTLYATPALYLLTALAVGAIQSTKIRRCCYTFLLSSFVLLSIANSTLPVRGDYLGAGELIRSIPSPVPILVSGDSSITRDIIAYNAEMPLDKFIDYSDELFDRAVDKVLGSSHSFWYVIEDTGSADPVAKIKHVEAKIASSKLRFKRYYFGGMQRLIVYKVFA